MIVLVFASLRARSGTWLGAFIMAVATSAVVGVAISQMETEAALPEELAGIISSYSSLMLILALVAAALIMVSVSFRTTTILLPDYALWKLAGVTPAGVRTVVIIQAMIVASLGAIVGAALAYPFAQFYFEYAAENSANLDWTGARLSFGPLTVIVAFLATIICALLASIRGASVAANTPEIEVLTDTLRPCKPNLILRWALGILLAAAVAVLAYMVNTVTGEPRDVVVSVVGLTIAIGFGVMAVITVLAPFVLPGVVSSGRGLRSSPAGCPPSGSWHDDPASTECGRARPRSSRCHSRSASSEHSSQPSAPGIRRLPTSGGSNWDSPR